MKISIPVIFLTMLLASCSSPGPKQVQGEANAPIIGTWKLLSGTLVQKGDTTVTDYTKEISFIKVINPTHFAFLQHNTKNQKDTANFSAGGGRYTLNNNSYTEHLEYCNAYEWQGHDFTFTIAIKNDTLTQTGIEKIEGQGINRLNIEKYVRLK